jgi:Tfp pilus assembly protein PilE
MSMVDIVILIIVIGILSAITYFRFIKKGSTLGCNCSLKSSCSLKVETLKAMFEDIQNT